TGSPPNLPRLTRQGSTYRHANWCPGTVVGRCRVCASRPQTGGKEGIPRRRPRHPPPGISLGCSRGLVRSPCPEPEELVPHPAGQRGEHSLGRLHLGLVPARLGIV